MIDSHVHLSGRETWHQVVEALDAAEIDAACLIGPFLDSKTWIPCRGAALESANRYLLELVAHAPDRLWALATVDPLDRDAARQIERFAVNRLVRGIKLIPHDWEPADARDVYAACARASLPILFHAGIFVSGRCSERCRPAKFEVVRDYPDLTVVLAHMAWPWVDEAIAVALMDPLKRVRPQILLDVSPGTPPTYRDEALRKGLSVLGSSLLLFGTDVFCPFDPVDVRQRVQADRDRLIACGAGEEDLEAIFTANAARVFASRG